MKLGWAKAAALFAAVGVIAGGVLLGTGLMQEASAQQVSQRTLNRGKSIFQVRANCAFCHGWSGDGQGDERSARPGLSLRETALTREQLIETVSCGRPGTGMPYHDGKAYTDTRCYGMTADDLGDQMPDRAQQTLQKAEIEAVVEYLLAKVVGRGPITRAECEEFFEPGAQSCQQYN